MQIGFLPYPILYILVFQTNSYDVKIEISSVDGKLIENNILQIKSSYERLEIV